MPQTTRGGVGGRPDFLSIRLQLWAGQATLNTFDRLVGEIGLEICEAVGIIPLTFRVNDLNSGWVCCPHFPALSGFRNTIM